MEDLITVIIPVYNKEKYIERTLNSIINQSYSNLEIIIVNDGSTDGSRDLCAKFQKKDTRIKLINTENHGAGHARNIGINRAKGQYISFIDADDYIDENYYEILYSMIINASADIAECRYIRVSGKEENINVDKENEIRVVNNIQKLKELYGRNEEEYVNTVIMCNKLFKKELFNNVHYPEGRIIDDEFITYKLIYASKKIAVTNSRLYYYVQSQNSVMRDNFKEQRVKDTINVYDAVYEFSVKNNIQEIIDLVLIRYLQYCIELIQKTKKSIQISDKNQVINYICEKFNEKRAIANNRCSSDNDFIKEIEELEDKFSMETNNK